MITIQEIADIAGVSRRTVDRVIHQKGSVRPETQRRVLEVIEQYQYRPNLAAKGLAIRKKELKIGFCSVRGELYPVQDEFRAGAEEKAEELKEYGVTVEFYTFPKENVLPPDKIREIADAFDCDALAVAPGGTPGIHELIEQAELRGIPVVFYNVDDSTRDRLCYVGCDYEQSGRIAAGLAALSVGEHGNALICSMNVSNEYSYDLRIRGFEQEIHDKYPEINISGTVLLDRKNYIDSVKNAAHAYPDTDVIYLVNPGDYSVCPVMKAAFPKLTIHCISNDLLPSSRRLLENGCLTAVVSQQLRRQGSLALEILFHLLAYNIRPEQESYYTNLSIFIGQNAQYIE